MTTAQQVEDLLRVKREIDNMPAGTFTANHRWLLEAVEVLLRHQIELHDELRNAGILR